MEHLQREEPFSSDPYFSNYNHPFKDRCIGVQQEHNKLFLIDTRDFTVLPNYLKG